MHVSEWPGLASTPQQRALSRQATAAGSSWRPCDHASSSRLQQCWFDGCPVIMQVGYKVAAGEYWRLITAAFVHGNVIHVGVRPAAGRPVLLLCSCVLPLLHALLCKHSQSPAALCMPADQQPGAVECRRRRGAAAGQPRVHSCLPGLCAGRQHCWLLAGPWLHERIGLVR